MRPNQKYRYDSWYRSGSGEVGRLVEVEGHHYTTSYLDRPVDPSLVYILEDMRTETWVVLGSTGDPEVYPDRDTAIAAAMHR